MDNFKIKFKELFKKEFYNGRFIELHSGDVDRIIELAEELYNEEKVFKCTCDSSDGECHNCFIE